MQQANTGKVFKVSCNLLKILASICRLESFTCIPIQILFVPGHFGLRNMKPNAHTELGPPVVRQQGRRWAWEFPVL